jgi:hypothetical protein
MGRSHRCRPNRVRRTVCLILVWYWTGRESGPIAHRYFFEWFSAWFLTQVIPLTFASLPYHGGQYTVHRPVAGKARTLMGANIDKGSRLAAGGSRRTVPSTTGKSIHQIKKASPGTLPGRAP